MTTARSSGRNRWRLACLLSVLLAACELIVHFDPPPEGGEQCADGLDNDDNGLIDCRDPGCASSPACQTPVCGNGVVDPPRPGLATPSPVPVSGAPSFLASADFDDDGVLDLAVAVPGDTASQVVVLLGSDGTFVAQPPLAVEGTVTAIAAGDMNGDGRPDLVVTGGVGGSMTIFLNSGGGAFQGTSGFQLGGVPGGVVLVDLDGDGDLDVAVTNSTGGSLAVLHNVGDGAFRVTQVVTVEAGAGPVAGADLDGDPFPDLVVADAQTSHLSLIRGLGGGELDAPVSVTVGRLPVALAVADVNGDGLDDLVSANAGSSDVSILLAGSTGQFAGTTVAVAAAPSAIAVLDLDGDGDLDLVVTLAGGDLALLANDGAGGFAAASTVTLGGAGAGLATLYVDGDTRPDVAVAEPQAGRVEILKGAGQTEVCDGTAGCAADCTLPGGSAVWAESFGGASNDVATDVAVDDTGNVYVVGRFAGTMTLGPGAALVSAGLGDIFVASFTAGGTFRWRAAFGGASDDFAAAVAWDRAGRTLVIAGGAGPVVFGSQSFSQTGRAFIVHLDPATGAVVDATDVIGGKANGSVSTVTVDASGRLFAGGKFDGDIPIGTTSITGPGAFFTSYQDGEQVWIQGLTGDATNDVVRVRADGAGPVVQVAYQGTIRELDIASELPALFVARYDAQGGQRWRVGGQASGASGAAPSDLALDPLGRAIAFGSFTGGLSVVNSSLSSAGGSDVYVLVVAPDGVVASLRSLAGGADDTAAGAAADARGDFIVGGAFPVSGAPMTSSVASLPPDGAAARWTQSGGYTALRFAVARDGALYMAGRLTATTQLAGKTLTPSGAADALVARLRP